MNRFINKILKEAKEDDPFFQPKDISGRDEELERQREDILHKIKLGLENIKVDYENEDWETNEEETFLKIFSEFHLDEEYDKKRKTYFLKNEKNENVCSFDLKYNVSLVSHGHVWSIFEKKSHLNYYEIQSFIKNMLKKHFKLNEFTPIVFWFI